MFPTSMDYDVLVKTLLIGDAGVGKSTFCTKLTTDDYVYSYSSTIGVDFFIKYIDIFNKVFKLQIWDTAGQEKFQSIVSSYYRNSSLVIIMIDVNKPECINNLSKWLDKVNMYCTSDVKKIIIGNKADLEIKIDLTKLNNILKHTKIPYMQISVKDDKNFNELIQLIHNKICDLPLNYYEFETIELGQEQPNKKKLFGCCNIL
jgi:Ras-related protein Rab-1A